MERHKPEPLLHQLEVQRRQGEHFGIQRRHPALFRIPALPRDVGRQAQLERGSSIRLLPAAQERKAPGAAELRPVVRVRKEQQEAGEFRPAGRRPRRRHGQHLRLHLQRTHQQGRTHLLKTVFQCRPERPAFIPYGHGEDTRRREPEQVLHLTHPVYLPLQRQGHGPESELERPASVAGADTQARRQHEPLSGGSRQSRPQTWPQLQSFLHHRKFFQPQSPESEY